MMNEDELLTEREAAKALRISQRQLQRQNAKNDGPPKVRLTARRIAYRRSDLRAWSAARVESERPEIGRLQVLLDALRQSRPTPLPPKLEAALAELQEALEHEQNDLTTPMPAKLSVSACGSRLPKPTGNSFHERASPTLGKRMSPEHPIQGLAITSCAAVRLIDAHQRSLTTKPPSTHDPFVVQSK